MTYIVVPSPRQLTLRPTIEMPFVDLDALLEASRSEHDRKTITMPAVIVDTAKK